MRYFLAREVQPFFDNVMSQDVLSGHNEISFFMGKDPKLPSAVFFGGVDDRFFNGDIVYFPVTQEHYWSVDVIDFKIGDLSHVEFIEFKNEGPRVSKLILDSVPSPSAKRMVGCTFSWARAQPVR